MDAARAYGTGCFKEHRTYDLRGLSEGEILVSTQLSPPFPKKLWGTFWGGGRAPSLVAHLDVSDGGHAPVFGLSLTERRTLETVLP